MGTFRLAARRLVHRILTTGMSIHWTMLHHAIHAETWRKSMTFGKRAFAIAALALCCLAPARAAPPAAGEPAPKHFLWKVTGPKGVVYLLGTIHAGKADFYPLPSIIEDSFKKANTLIEEVDISEPAEAARVQQGLIEDGSYANGDTITNHLSEATRSHLEAYLKKGGLPEPAIAHMRP